MIPQSDKKVPEILSEEELPFSPDEISETHPLRKEIGTGSSIDFKRLSIGYITLILCISLMFACIVLSIWNPDNELIKDGFDGFRLIVMAILGYIFGANKSK